MITRLIPRPKGEGGVKHRVRGAEILLCTPHPALRAHPLPTGEGFLPNITNLYQGYRLFTDTERVETPLMVNVYIAFPSTLI